LVSLISGGDGSLGEGVIIGDDEAQELGTEAKEVAGLFGLEEDLMDVEGAPRDDDEIIDLDKILQEDLDAVLEPDVVEPMVEEMEVDADAEQGEDAPPPQEPEISSEEDEALGRRSRRRKQAPTRLDPSAAQVAPRRRRTRTSITTRWGGTIEWPPQGWIMGCIQCQDNSEGCRKCQNSEWQRGINGRMNQMRLEDKNGVRPRDGVAHVRI